MTATKWAVLKVHDDIFGFRRLFKCKIHRKLLTFGGLHLNTDFFTVARANFLGEAIIAILRGNSMRNTRRKRRKYNRKQGDFVHQAK